jgi:Fe2+ transport system protein FeoA
MKLTEVKENKEIIVISIIGGRQAKKKLLSLGIIPDKRLQVVKNNDKHPLIVLIGKTQFILGRGIAEKILVEEVVCMQESG